MTTLDNKGLESVLAQLRAVQAAWGRAQTNLIAVLCNELHLIS